MWKKLALLFLALLIALTFLPAAFSTWSENVTVTGTVRTGHWEVDEGKGRH